MPVKFILPRPFMTAAVACLALVVSGCEANQAETIDAREAIQTERLLAASGFQMRLADTPERQAQLNTFPQLRLFIQDQEGAPIYVYADSVYCECIYAGSERSFRRYERFHEQRGSEVEHAFETPHAPSRKMIGWDTWGPWNPWL